MRHYKSIRLPNFGGRKKWSNFFSESSWRPLVWSILCCFCVACVGNNVYTFWLILILGASKMCDYAYCVVNFLWRYSISVEPNRRTTSRRELIYLCWFFIDCLHYIWSVWNLPPPSENLCCRSLVLLCSEVYVIYTVTARCFQRFI